ncbi:hypothetical protein [Catellatospora vulcania]|uniref:hypothetical protein n=1 Tax=Catellatospora vulcania TaxID=1460450 RepID=UPI0012D3B3D3|nr:hypothetical protein [Catellatospora vulcania]
MSEPDEKLARRYERLLALFPAAHRHEYEDEMIGVLMAGAKPQQRYPGLRETANLVRCAAWMRLGGRGGGAAGSRWAPATAVFALVASFMMFTFHAGALASRLIWIWRYEGLLIPLPVTAWLPLAGWTVAVVFAYTGFRLVAAVGAWTAALCELARVLLDYSTGPTGLVLFWWMIVLGISAALALTARGRTRPQVGLGDRRTVIVTLAFAALAVLPIVEVMLSVVTRTPGGAIDGISAFGGYSTSGGFGGYYLSGIISEVSGPILVLVILVCLLRTASPVRRRLVAMFTPALTLYLLVPTLFNGFIMSTQRFNPPVLLEPVQWVFLVGFPVLLFLSGAALVERGERHAYLIGLGRAAEREARLKRAAAPS